MDTIGTELPKLRKRVDRTVAAAAIAATAAAALAVGYAAGTASDPAAPALTVVVSGVPATSDDTLRESFAVKAHDRRAAAARRGASGYEPGPVRGRFWTSLR